MYDEELDTIDAALFSGDYFYDKDKMKELEYYLERWQKQAQQIKEIVKESNEKL